MNKQQLATTPAQSVQLLQAGISQETADFHWVKSCVKDENGNLKDVLFTGCFMDSYHPAWSLTALWRLAKEKGLSLVFSTGDDTPEDIVSLIVKALTDNDTEKD